MSRPASLPGSVPSAEIGRTVLARVCLSVEDGDGHAAVVIERRTHDEDLARRWCLRTLAARPESSTVSEIEVVVESWARRRPWDAKSHRPMSESVQVGILLASGEVRWSSPQTTSVRSGLRG